MRTSEGQQATESATVHPHHASALALRQRLKTVARALDSGFGIPGTRWRFGIDSLVGLIPVVGDLFGLLLGAYFLFEGLRIGAPALLLIRMLGNVLLDMLIGLVPVIGDIGDVVFKSNPRNAALLAAHLDQLWTPAPVSRRRSWRFWVLALLVLAPIVWALVWWLQR